MSTKHNDRVDRCQWADAVGAGGRCGLARLSRPGWRLLRVPNDAKAIPDLGLLPVS